MFVPLCLYISYTHFHLSLFLFSSLLFSSLFIVSQKKKRLRPSRFRQAVGFSFSVCERKRLRQLRDQEVTLAVTFVIAQAFATITLLAYQAMAPNFIIIFLGLYYCICGFFLADIYYMIKLVIFILTKIFSFFQIRRQ